MNKPSVLDAFRADRDSERRLLEIALKNAQKDLAWTELEAGRGNKEARERLPVLQADVDDLQIRLEALDG